MSDSESRASRGGLGGSRHRQRLLRMRQVAPGKTFIEAPTAGTSATCRSCAHCPWMGMNELQNLYGSLAAGTNEVTVEAEIARRALVPLERMVSFANSDDYRLRAKR